MLSDIVLMEPDQRGRGVYVPDDDLARLCVTAASRGDRLPVRTSLAAGLYGEEIVRSRRDDLGERRERV